ncbi:MAG: glycerate kinase [Sporichthyaceae bacterium]
MRILVAPDKFAGTLTAAQAAAAIRAGWLATAPDDELELVPLSDGGPGFLDVLAPALGGDLDSVSVTGPLGDPVEARVLVRTVGGTRTAYVESADACGLHLIAANRRDAGTATSCGVGELVLVALDRGCRRVVVGVGGTASTDGGAGLLAALGAGPRDLLAGGGAGLMNVGDVDLGPARRRVEGVSLVAATDVGGPLMGSDGAALGYAEQKGADRATRDLLETAMRAWATATEGAIAVRPGAGAGGGLGYGLLLLGAERVSGATITVEATGLAGRAATVDLVVTGEGAFDWQSLRGKTVAGVARAAQEAGRPVVVLAGRVEVGRRDLANAGIDAAYAIDDLPAGEAGHTPEEALAALAERVARTWSR